MQTITAKPIKVCVTTGYHTHLIRKKDKENIMLNKLFRKLFKKEPDKVSVNIEPSDAILTVRLSVNGVRRARIQCVIESAHTILIGDIIHDNQDADYNKGYGTLMVERLVAYARETGYSYIYGNLSKVDLDHKERLHHFYKKLGFRVTEYTEPKECYYGIIEMHLK